MFSHCKSLTEIDGDNIELIGDSAFEDAENLIKINLKKVKEISESSLKDCTEIIDKINSNPDSEDFSKTVKLNYLKADVWKRCWEINGNILKVKDEITSFPRAECLPDQVLSDITELDLNALTSWDHALHDSILPNVKKIQGSKITKFSRFSSRPTNAILEEIDLPKCSYIGLGAFVGCKRLQKIDLPECTCIVADAFTGCASLQKIDLPKCTTIGNMAFMDCTGLRDVNLPCCNEIGQEAFANCCNLERIVLETDKPLQLENFIFLNCKKLDFKDESKLKLSSKNENLRYILISECRDRTPEQVDAEDDKFDVKNDVENIRGAYRPPYIFKNVSENEKLFPHGDMPNASDISQGTVGDCWLLAALSSLAASNPQAIKNCFIENKQNRRLITVRLHKVEILNDRYVPCGLMDIKLNKSVAKDNSWLKFFARFFTFGLYSIDAFCDNNALWVRLLEKAFTVYVRHNGFKKSENAKYQMRKDLAGAGTMGEHAVIAAITGNPAKSKEIRKPINEQTTKNTFNSIKKAVEKNRAITASCSPSQRLQGLPESHAYSVLGIIEKNSPTTVHNTYNQQEGHKMIDNFLESKNISLKSNNKYIILRNPHAGKGMFFEKGAEKGRIISEANGICIIEHSSFCKLFPRIEYSARKFIPKKFNT